MPKHTEPDADTDAAPPYDVHFCFPVPVLESDRLRLTPFIPSLHAAAVYEALAPDVRSFDYVPLHPWPSQAAFEEWVEQRVRRDPALVLFAMIDTTVKHIDIDANRDAESNANDRTEANAGAIAGIIGLLATDPRARSTEIGLLFTLPAARGTHATAHAVGLPLRWCFTTLNMARVQWRTSAENVRSLRAAQRMGFTIESVRRWDGVLPLGKPGLAPREGEEGERAGCAGADTTYLSMVADEWPQWEARVREVMDRR